MSKDFFYLRCPNCGEEISPVADSTGNTARVTAPVIVLQDGSPAIDWDEADVTAELYYYCPACDEKLPAGCVEDLAGLK